MPVLTHSIPLSHDWGERRYFPVCLWITEAQLQSLDVLQNFLGQIRQLKIVFDQYKEANRNNVIQMLKCLAKEGKKLQSLTIICCGENALFYSGLGILDSLMELCRKESKVDLHHIDLRKLPFTLSDGFTRLIATGSPNSIACSSRIERLQSDS